MTHMFNGIVYGKHAIPPEIWDEVHSRIEQIEAEHGVQVIYVCESGSRSWGFASPDSDFDVRFIYMHPRDWYLRCNEPRDVIEMPVDHDQELDIDMNGWDLKKALTLMKKSNPGLLEWMTAPIVYHRRGGAGIITALIKECYSPRRAAYHYYHMAKSNFREYLRKPEVPLKKYLYVLRPLLAVRYIERCHDEPIPVSFDELLSIEGAYPYVSAEVLRHIKTILELKKRSTEKEFIPLIPAVNDFIDIEINRNGKRKAAFEHLPCRPNPIEGVNETFRHILKTWGH